MITSPDSLAAKLPAWLQEDALQPHWVAGASSPAPEPVTEHEPNPYPKPGAEPNELTPEPRRKFKNGRMMSFDFEPLDISDEEELFDVDDLSLIFSTPKTTTTNRPPPNWNRNHAIEPIVVNDDEWEEYDYDDYDQTKPLSIEQKRSLENLLKQLGFALN